MGFKDTLNNILYGKEKDEEYNEEDYEEDYSGQEDDNGGFVPQKGNRQYQNEQNSGSRREEYVPSKQSTNVNMASGSAIEMKVVKPERLENVTQIADFLLEKKTILLNLEDTNKETARRIIDFMNGVAYAINGDLRKVANSTYVVTPSNVEVSGDQLKETQEKGDLIK
ncbi:MAG: cell division protein SepF [Oscillospiraceae bacterium]|nr:cell division protein SepF [Oscillospiraceae bacterium]